MDTDSPACGVTGRWEEVRPVLGDEPEAACGPEPGRQPERARRQAVGDRGDHEQPETELILVDSPAEHVHPRAVGVPLEVVED